MYARLCTSLKPPPICEERMQDYKDTINKHITQGFLLPVTAEENLWYTLYLGGELKLRTTLV